MGGINFAWLAVWVLSPDWLSRKLEVCAFFPGASVKPTHLRDRGAGPALICIIYLGICVTTEEKSRNNLSQGNRKALG
jgi:hypothetical protein